MTVGLVLVVADETLGQVLAREVEALAERMGITQKELLARARLRDGSQAVGTTAFIDWKNGTTSPTIERLEALAAVVGKRLEARVGTEAAQRRPALSPEAVEAAEWINLVEDDVLRKRASEAAIRIAKELRQGKVKPGS